MAFILLIDYMSAVAEEQEAQKILDKECLRMIKELVESLIERFIIAFIYRRRNPLPGGDRRATNSRRLKQKRQNDTKYPALRDK